MSMLAHHSRSLKCTPQPLSQVHITDLEQARRTDKTPNMADLITVQLCELRQLDVAAVVLVQDLTAAEPTTSVTC